jgi:hypothetical protein
MSTRAAKGTHVRGYRRRKAVLDLDLNNAPPIENRDQEGTSTQVGRNEVQAGQVGQSVPPATIDVEAIDDDVIESSPTAFAQVCLFGFISFCFILFLVYGLIVATNHANSLIFYVRPKTIQEGTREGL